MDETIIDTPDSNEETNLTSEETVTLESIVDNLVTLNEDNKILFPNMREPEDIEIRAFDMASEKTALKKSPFPWMK